ncbi:hypothetical protein [Amycolatopsis sp. EV170708-02-1]|nr:hypothetical protein [Amycolatopsis sp. EV170708-02-1]UMP05590.1 hypothetical protein MJQ72_12490 [Amycolatopsis sp. EV170708-02-1]
MTVLGNSFGGWFALPVHVIWRESDTSTFTCPRLETPEELLAVGVR